MHNLISGVFEHLEITFPNDVDKRVNYTQRLLRRAALKEYKAVFKKCKEYSKEIARYQWTLVETKNITMEILWTWSKQYGLDDDRDAYLGVDMYINFKKDVWFMLLKSMWKKHQSVFQDHVKYIHSDIVKPF